MSTGFDHSDKASHLSFDSINHQVQQFDQVSVMSEGVVQDMAAQTEQLVTVYASARPILAALATVPLIPAKWRAVLNIFVTTLDGVSASFKAGKDLATTPVAGGTKADMEPKLPVG